MELPVGKAEELCTGDTVALICTGPVANTAFAAAARFPGKAGVYNFRFLKPLDTEMLDGIASRYSHVITLEDGTLKGGLFGAVCEYFAGRKDAPAIEGIGIPDEFLSHTSRSEELEMCGLDEASVSAKIAALLN